ncbi:MULTISPECIES: DUF2637 domain-containing protein [unclassified Streptomyces]|uniref:DUF2637 domain-containing protein n=1 Tax=unclassified Streptomyces TaxID=2593676 RepID=UPI0033B90FA8
MEKLDGVTLGVTGVGMAVLVTAAAYLLRRARAQRPATTTPEERTQLSKVRRDAWRRGLSVAALGAGCLMLFAIAGTAGWLSFAAQRGYAFSRNGGDWNAATGFALLLDAGTLGLSLFRFFEALTLRSSALTRLLLVGFVGASAQMNFLHAPTSESGVVDFGSRFVAVVPPLVYAVLLEMLLFKVEQVIMGKRPKRRRDRERGYSLLLWVPFIGYPREMWKAWREDLHHTLENVRAPGSLKSYPAPRDQPGSGENEEATSPQPALPNSLQGVTPPTPDITGKLTSKPPVVPTSTATTIYTAPGTPAEVAVADVPTRTMLTAPSTSSPSKKPTLKQQLFDGLVQEMRNGVWDAVSEDPIARTAAWVRVNERLGQERGSETLLAYNSARNAFRDLAPELQAAAEEIRSELRDAAAHQRSGPERSIPSSRPKLGEVEEQRTTRVPA